MTRSTDNVSVGLNLLGIAFAVAFLATVPLTAGALTPGDLNQDCAINVIDAHLLARHLDGTDSYTLTGDALTAADVAPYGAPNQQVDSADLLVLHRSLNGGLPLAPGLTLDPIASPADSNPVLVTGAVDCPATEVTLYVNDELFGTTTPAQDGTFGFANVVLLDGTNQIVASVQIASVTTRSVPLSRDYQNSLNHTLVDGVTIGDGNTETVVAWTPGTQNPNAGPYTIGDNSGTNGFVLIKSKATLILTRGTKLQFKQNATTSLINVEPGGTLVIEGTEAEPVILTSDRGDNHPGDWFGILLNGGATASIEHAKIYSATYAIAMINNTSQYPPPAESLLPNSLVLRDSSIKAVSLNGIKIAADLYSSNEGNSTAIIENCEISNVVKNLAGIDLSTSGAVSIENCNSIKGFIYGIRNLKSSSPLIAGNVIEGNTWGIHAEGTAAPLINGGNVIQNNSGGGVNIYAYGSDVPFPVINDNTIESNLHNIYISDTFLASAPIYDATRNYWGTDDASVIQDSIFFASPYNGNRPIVRFLPYRDSQGELVVGVGNTFTAGPLPENDVTLLSGEVYDFVGTVTVGAAQTLTIQSGAVVIVADNEKIVVDGQLLYEQGTIAEPFEITCDASGGACTRWGGILVNSGGTATLQNGILSNANTALEVAANGTGNLSDSEIRNAVLGVHMSGGGGTIAGNTFINPSFPHGGIGIQVDATTDAVDLDGNTITSHGFGVNVSGAVPSLQIRNNTILKAFWTGITMNGCGPLPAQCGVIEGNTLDPAGAGNNGTVKNIDLIDASPTLIGNIIRNAAAGIHVRGESNPVIGDGDYANHKNVITNNVWGIWIKGSAASGSLIDPNPVIRGNEIHDNAGAAPSGLEICRPGSAAGADICISYMQVGTTATIDATNNNWNTTMPGEIRAAIVSSDNLVPVDISDYLDPATGLVVPETSDLYSFLITNVSHDTDDASAPDFIWPGYPGAGPKQFNVHFDLVAAADVTVKIFPWNDLGNPVAILPRAGPLSAPAAGSYTIDWDGMDNGSPAAPVPDGAYYYVIQTGSAYPDYNPAAKSDDVARTERGTPQEQLASYNVYENKFYKVLFDVMLNPARLRVDVNPGNAFWNSLSTTVIDNLAVPVRENHLVVWDGRLPDGSIFQPDANGEIYFNLTSFTETDAFQRNLVIVERSRPAITGPEYEASAAFPNVEVKSDPWLIHPSYEQISTLRYCVDRPSKVTIKVLSPGFNDPANPAAVADTLLSDASVSAVSCTGSGYHEVEWRAYDAADTNRILSNPGALTFTIEAIPDVTPTQPGVKSLYRGVIQLQY